MTYTLDLEDNQIELLIDKYFDYQLEKTNDYTVFRAKVATTTITIFSTNKVVLQGNNAYKMYVTICNAFNIPVASEEKAKADIVEINSFNLSIAGSDEVGTGDYFGPIVVSACFVDKDQILELKRLGVKDSKKVEDNKILELAKEIKARTINASVILSNEQFNTIMRQPNMNMNKIKAILHNKALSNLLAKGINPDAIVIDGFTTQEKYFEYLANRDSVVKEKVKVVEKGEDKYISVAAASILARAYFLKHFEELCAKYGYNLPKGAGPEVDKMIYTITSHGKKDILKYIAKLSFNNTFKAKKDPLEWVLLFKIKKRGHDVAFNLRMICDIHLF